MKNVNILSIIEAYRKLSNTLFQKLMNSYGIISGIKDYELNGIESFVNELLKIKNSITIVNNYYLGYSIPQIGKEFDLLRFGDNYIINIEIKTESSIDKIFKQQQKNKYYLEFLNKEIYIYTYILNENKLYKLIRKDSNNEIKEATFNELCNKLLLQEVVTFNNIDDLFNPSDYLVSPFNSPEKFMAEGYFLTVQQEQIYNEIRTKLSDATTKFIALTGSAGTGKTLLTYHIAKESIRKGEKVLILHCAPLNSGHKILMEEYGWSIHMPKYAPNTTDFDLIIIDEAQRMYPYQFDKYIEEVRTFNKKCIFSYDENQYLRDNEKNYHTKERIEKELSCTPYKLTDKIRTNKEIAYFIRQLFNLKKNISNIDYPNIELTYCKNYFSAKSLLQELSKKNWKVPNYTPGTRSTFHYEAYLSGDTECAHSVVGQEFDNVVIVIDDSFKYNSQGDLIADNTYYKTCMSAILIEGDAEGWYESGPVNDVLIQNNIFIGCAYSGGPENAVIALHPSNMVVDAERPVHRNVRIIGNTFRTFGNPVLYAKSTKDLIFKENHVECTSSDDFRQKPLFILNGCKGVVIRENKLEEVCDKKMEFRQMKKKYIKVDF